MNAPDTPGRGGPALLAVRGLVKRFAGVTALAGVDLELRPGVIHALCGENGAGKSTLIKVLAGIHPHGSYDGELTMAGEPARFRRPGDAIAAGIGVIHQELALVGELSVAENISLGREPGRGPFVDRLAMESRARELLARAATAALAALSRAARQMPIGCWQPCCLRQQRPSHRGSHDHACRPPLHPIGGARFQPGHRPACHRRGLRLAGARLPQRAQPLQPRVDFAITAVLALGVFLVLLPGQTDLATGSGAGLAGGAAAVLIIHHGWPAPLALIAALVGIIALWRAMGALSERHWVPGCGFTRTARSARAFREQPAR